MRTRDEKKASGGPRRKMCALPSKEETLGSPACVAIECRVGSREWKHEQGQDLVWEPVWKSCRAETPV